MFRHSRTLREDPNEQLIEKEADVLLEVELSDCLYDQIIHLFSLSRRPTRFTSLKLFLQRVLEVNSSVYFPHGLSEQRYNRRNTESLSLKVSDSKRKSKLNIFNVCKLHLKEQKLKFSHHLLAFMRMESLLKVAAFSETTEVDGDLFYLLFIYLYAQ